VEGGHRTEWMDDFVVALIKRVAQAEAGQTALKLTALSQYDEMQGLCRLILSESGGAK
jgi:hypothetical protein